MFDGTTAPLTFAATVILTFWLLEVCALAVLGLWTEDGRSSSSSPSEPTTTER